MDIRHFAAIAILLASPAMLSDAAGPLVVHEWGTFTSVQSGDGVQVAWNPLIRTDLPDFVYSTDRGNGGFRNVALVASKAGDRAILRMETPVIYFYSDTEVTVDVKVSFPNGRITEWYPQANLVKPFFDVSRKVADQESLIEWNAVRVLSPSTREIQPDQLLRDREDVHARHYYAARATDANLLRASSPHARTKLEYERDLFYRGIGYRPAPLIVKTDEGGRLLTLSVATQHALPAAFVVTVDRSLMRYQKLGELSPQVEHTVELDLEPFDALANVRGRLMKEMATTLVEQGLYPKEALAMVDTWKDQWFEEQGTRVLYVLPRAWTDDTLPLEISPAADSTVRVMIGRAEVIAPAVTRELQRQILAFRSNAARSVDAVAKLNLGRFLEPAMTIALGRSPSEDEYTAAWELQMQVSRAQHRDLQAQTAVIGD